MQDYQILLDGAAVPPEEFSGTAGTRVTVEQKDGESTISYANSLTFYGQSRDYILNKLVYGANPQIDFVTVKIYDGCCTDGAGNGLLIFEGKATRADIEFCDPAYNEDCGVTMSLADASTAADAIQCVRNVLITQRRYGARTSGGENTYRPSVQFGYYEETRPKSFTRITLITILILLTLYAPIVAIIQIVSFGFLDLSLLYNGALDVLLKKRWHKSPFIHSYLSNVCQLCGLRLRSSLFEPTGVYHNLTRLDTAFSEGGIGLASGLSGSSGISPTQAYRDFNSPNITLPELMRSLAELNIGYLVTGTDLIVERKDFFGNNIWIDFTQRQSDILELCFTASEEAQPAGEVFAFTEDGSDKLGNEANPLWSGEVVDYNTPIIPTLRGIKQTTIQYGTARFLGDGLESVIFDVLNSGYANAITFGAINITTGSLLMTTGTASVPKLLMYDGFSNPNDAQVEVLGGKYNGRAWLRADTQSAYGFAGFYDNLLRINDPRLNLQRNLSYKLRFSYICEDLRTRSFGQVVQIPINGTNVLARIDTVEIDFESREITISGVI